jgi:hypothetical protein
MRDGHIGCRSEHPGEDRLPSWLAIVLDREGVEGRRIRLGDTGFYGTPSIELRQRLPGLEQCLQAAQDLRPSCGAGTTDCAAFGKFVVNKS